MNPLPKKTPRQVRRCAALLRDERRIDTALKPIFSKDAELLQRFVEPWLHRHFDEPVGRLMEYAAAHGEIGREVVVLMQRIDDEARDHGESVAISRAYLPCPFMSSVPSMRMSAASVAFSQCEHPGATRESSSLTSVVNDMSLRSSRRHIQLEDISERTSERRRIVPRGALRIDHVAHEHHGAILLDLLNILIRYFY